MRILVILRCTGRKKRFLEKKDHCYYFRPRLYRKQLFRLKKTIQKEKLNQEKWKDEQKVKGKLNRALSKEGERLLVVTEMFQTLWD